MNTVILLIKLMETTVALLHFYPLISCVTTPNIKERAIAVTPRIHCHGCICRDPQVLQCRKCVV